MRFVHNLMDTIKLLHICVTLKNCKGYNKNVKDNIFIKNNKSSYLLEFQLEVLNYGPVELIYEFC